jgi:hypothetical protein
MITIWNIVIIMTMILSIVSIVISAKSGKDGKGGEDGKGGGDGSKGPKGETGIQGKEGKQGKEGQKGERGAQGTIERQNFIWSLATGDNAFRSNTFFTIGKIAILSLSFTMTRDAEYMLIGHTDVLPLVNPDVNAQRYPIYGTLSGPVANCSFIDGKGDVYIQHNSTPLINRPTNVQLIYTIK